MIKKKKKGKGKLKKYIVTIDLNKQITKCDYKVLTILASGNYAAFQLSQSSEVEATNDVTPEFAHQNHHRDMSTDNNRFNETQIRQKHNKKGIALLRLSTADVPSSHLGF